MNGSGEVVGQSENANGLGRAFAWTPAGGIVALGSFNGFDATDALAINDSGQIVGEAVASNQNGPPDPITCCEHPFLYSAAGGFTDLGNLGGIEGAATAINANGHVAGWSETPAGVSDLFLWTQAGGMVDLGTLGGQSLGHRLRGERHRSDRWHRAADDGSECFTRSRGRRRAGWSTSARSGAPVRSPSA